MGKDNQWRPLTACQPCLAVAWRIKKAVGQLLLGCGIGHGFGMGNILRQQPVGSLYQHTDLPTGEGDVHYRCTAIGGAGQTEQSGAVVGQPPKAGISLGQLLLFASISVTQSQATIALFAPAQCQPAIWQSKIMSGVELPGRWGVVGFARWQHVPLACCLPPGPPVAGAVCQAQQLIAVIE